MTNTTRNWTTCSPSGTPTRSRLVEFSRPRNVVCRVICRNTNCQHHAADSNTPGGWRQCWYWGRRVLIAQEPLLANCLAHGAGPEPVAGRQEHISPTSSGHCRPPPCRGLGLSGLFVFGPLAGLHCTAPTRCIVTDNEITRARFGGGDDRDFGLSCCRGMPVRKGPPRGLPEWYEQPGRSARIARAGQLLVSRRWP